MAGAAADESAESTESAAPARVADDAGLPRRTQWRRALVSALFLVVAVAAFCVALAGQWSETVDRLGDQRPAALIGSLGLALAGVYMSFLLWRGTLAVLGSRVPTPAAARLFFPTQLGKYLPGALWPVVAQMRMGRELGVPRQRMALAFLLTLGLATLVGILVGVAALPALLQAEGPVVLFGLLALPVLLALLVPRIINSLLDHALRVLRRPGLERPLAGRDIARGVLWALAFWLVYGSHVWLLAVGLGADPLEALPVTIGGFAIAFSLGPLLVVLPAGAGVREAVMVVLFSGLLTTPEATAVALTSRGILMLTDGLLALAAVLVPRRGR
ncbi:MAG TPA: lysylphosphatidylglycerol synthase domain-containing protein [Actinomycetes bacterium]